MSWACKCTHRHAWMHILHYKGSSHLQLKLCLAPLWQMLASAPAPDEAFGCFGAGAVAGFDISTPLPLRRIAWPGRGWQEGSATAWHQHMCRQRTGSAQGCSTPLLLAEQESRNHLWRVQSSPAPPERQQFSTGHCERPKGSKCPSLWCP